MFNKVVGNEVMVVGDLHISDVYHGKHKDYLAECMYVLRSITDKVQAEKPSALVLLGDIIGWNHPNIKDRQVFSWVCRVFQDWNKVCPVYALQGNHDMSKYPDFQFLSDFGLIITSSMCGGYFDYYGTEEQEKPEVRFHLVDYNNESKALNLCEGTSNVVLGHNNFTISGFTTWYAAHDGIELGMHSEFNGVDMVISGHIHNPSPEIYYATMPDGGTCGLFYVGCPTRPVKDPNIHESCWYLFIRYDKASESTNIEPEVFQLLPLSECFYEDEEFVDEKSEDELQDELRKEALKDILGDLLKYRMQGGDPIQQVMMIPNASDDAKQMAAKYLGIAYNGVD